MIKNLWNKILTSGAGAGAGAAFLLLCSCTSTSTLSPTPTPSPTLGGTVQTYQQQIVAACTIAEDLAGVDPAIGVYITAGCGTEEAIAALVLNPTSLAWLNSLISQASALKALKANHVSARSRFHY
jgi:hypothetical protein